MPRTLFVLDGAAAPCGSSSDIVGALDYIKGAGAELPPGTLVRNMSSDYGYLSLAYYVSLLAEARGHVPFPRTADLLNRGAARGAIDRPKRAAPRQHDEDPRIGVLFTPGNKFRASSRASLRDFARAAASCGTKVELLGASHISDALMGLSGLFIRDLTNPGNSAFRAALEAQKLGLPVIDDPASIIRCSNKVFIHHLLERHGIATPRTLLVAPDTPLHAILNELGLPLVLKVPDGSFSLGVHKVETAGDAERLIAALQSRYGLLSAQEYMPTDFDWRVGILAGKPLFACRYFMAPGHWQIVRHLAGNRRVDGDCVPVALPDVPAVVLDTARAAADLVGPGLYGVDIKQSGGRTCVIEINANPDIHSDAEAALPSSRVWARLAEWFARQAQGPAHAPALQASVA